MPVAGLRSITRLTERSANGIDSVAYELNAPAAALILAIFVRFWGLIGAPQILNLWLGLYNAQGERPWTYFFLLVLQLNFALHQFGRSLGVDAIIVERYRRAPRAAVPSLIWCWVR